MEKTYLELEAIRLRARADEFRAMAEEAEEAADEADRKASWENCPFTRTKWEAEQVELFKKAFGPCIGTLFRPPFAFEEYELKAKAQGLRPMFGERDQEA